MSLSDRSLSNAGPLRRAVRRGAGVMAGVQVASQLISLASLALLLRLLSPADYGLLGMVLPWVMLLRIFSTLGLNLVTVQRQEVTQAEVTGLFWMHVWLGVATSLATAAAAPVVGWLYAKPELARELTVLTLALAPTSLLTALAAQHTALLERNLRMPQLGVMRIVAQLTAAGGAVLAALTGWGVWSLVCGQYIELVLLIGLAWWFEPWRPGRPVLGSGLGKFIRWGSYFAASSFVLYLADNVDRVLVGRLVDHEAVGLYERAWALMIKPVLLVTTPLTGLLLASLARAAGDDASQRGQLLTAYYRLTAILLFPASLGLAVVAGDVMHVMGGSGWAPAGPLLAVLSLGMFAQAIVILNGYVLTAAGRTDRLLSASLIVLVVLVTGYLLGWWWGARRDRPTLGLATGYAIAIWLLAIPYTWLGTRLTSTSTIGVLATWHRPLSAAVVMALFVWMFGQWLQNALPAVRLAVLLPLGVAVYVVLARSEIAWLVAHVRQVLRPIPTVE